MRSLRIELPDWMLTDLRARAQRKGIDVVELLRRAAALERLLTDHDPTHEVVLRHRTTSDEVVLRFTDTTDAS